MGCGLPSTLEPGPCLVRGSPHPASLNSRAEQVIRSRGTRSRDFGFTHNHQQTPSKEVAHAHGRFFQLVGIYGICLLISTTLFAKPVETVYPEGVNEGFVTLKTLDGKQLADGGLSQVTTGADRLASRLTFRFSDGSLYDETVTFSQKKHLTLLSYQLTQRGPAFPEPLVVSLNGETGQYQVRQHEKSPDEKMITGHVDLPSDVYNGMTITVLKNLRGQTGALVHMLVFNPEPKLYEVELTRLDEEDIRNTTRKDTKATAVHYSLKPAPGMVHGGLGSAGGANSARLPFLAD